MDGEGKNTGEARPGEAKPAEVLKTGGEASAAGYAEAEVPEGPDCPTIEVDRVRIVPPSQTPTVKIAERAKRAGPRAPEQMVRPKAKGPVELPEGRPVTKMQVIEIDPEFLLGLERGREEEEGGTPEETAPAAEDAAGGRMESPWVREAPLQVAEVELPSAAGPPSAPVSTAVEKRAGKGGIVMGVAIGLTVAVMVLAAVRSGKGPAVEPAPKATASTPASPSAAVSTATTVTPNAAASDSRPAPSVSPSASFTPSAEATAAPSAMTTRTVKPRPDPDDPYAEQPRAAQPHDAGAPRSSKEPVINE